MPGLTRLDADTATAWAAKAHAYVLDALMTESTWTAKDVAFHGGTSLHLSWRSPRRSEDLDFLVSKHVEDVAKVMRAVEGRVQEAFLLEDPDLRVEVRDKTRDGARMPYFQVSVSSAKLAGKAMVKVEFWRVDPEYLAGYPTVFRTPLSDGDVVSSVTNPIPAARLDVAFCDKLTAFATRPHLKWRDVFDLWWIGTQTSTRLDVGEVCRQFLHNVQAYDTNGGLTPGAALRRFLERTDEEIFASAETDLRQWVPPALWRRLYPDVVREMVAYARSSLTVVADCLEDDVEPDDASVLNAVPR